MERKDVLKKIGMDLLVFVIALVLASIIVWALLTNIFLGIAVFVAILGLTSWFAVTDVKRTIKQSEIDRLKDK